MSREPRVAVMRLRQPDRPVPLVGPDAGVAEAVISPSMGARHRSINYIELHSGRATRELRHPGEAAYYTMRGSGTVRGASGPAHAIAVGSFVHVSPATAYRFDAGDDGLALFGGPCPPDPAIYAEAGGGVSGDPSADGAEGSAHGGGGGRIAVFSRDEPELMLPIVSKDARMIVWPGVGAWDATMNYVRMEPGEENEPHAHRTSEDTIVILEGRGSVEDLSNGTVLEFAAGDVVHVPPTVVHAVKANRGSAVVSAGGPCPADLPFLRACGATIPDRAAAAPGVRL